jgi:hypothetical protein
VTSDDLRPEQAAALKERVARHLRFLNRLVDRMTRLGFPPHDPLWAEAVKARNAAQDLYVACHYAACETGVGRRGKDDSTTV